MKKLFFIFLAYSLLASCNSDKEKVCLLKGKVLDRESTALMIVKPRESGDDNNYIEIPIKEDGSFEYTLPVDYIDIYILIFKEDFESGRFPEPVVFLTDSDVIEFELYPNENYEKNEIRGGEITELSNRYSDEKRKLFDVNFNPLNEKIIALHEDNHYYSEAYLNYSSIKDATKNDSIKYLMISKIDSLKENGADLTQEAIVINTQIDSILRDFKIWEQEYVLNNPSIFSYGILIRDIGFHYLNPNIEYANKAYTILKEKFPNHPYTAIADKSMFLINNLRVGGTIIDFTAPDINGKNIILSEVFQKNKLTLVNLWAPWCSPCISKNRLIAPIYKQYRENGFEVVSVIGEIEDLESFEKAVKKESYPWENLREINSENQIWEKYNISGNGGIMYLVDNEGKILISRPTPKEIEEFLKNKQPLLPSNLPEGEKLLEITL